MSQNHHGATLTDSNSFETDFKVLSRTASSLRCQYKRHIRLSPCSNPDRRDSFLITRLIIIIMIIIMMIIIIEGSVR